MSQQVTECDVLIVGAGISGLTAAYDLQRKSPDLNVVVLEARNRVGGRTHSVSLKTANGFDQWDIGGQWVGQSQIHALDLLKELDMEIYPQYVEGKKCSQLGSMELRRYKSDLPSFNMTEAFDFVRFVYNCERMAKRVNVLDPFVRSDSTRLDGMSVAEFMQQTVRTDAVREAAEVALMTSLGTRTGSISALYFAWYGKAAGSVMDLLQTRNNGAQGYKVRKCAGQIATNLANKLKPSTVQLQQVVTRIATNPGNSPTADVLTQGGTTFRCKRVIIAIPPAEIANITFEKPLSEARRQLIRSFPMGNLIKFVVTYRTPFWREAGFSGEIVASGRTETPNVVNPVMVTFDGTTENGNPALVGFLHLEWADKPFGERKNAVLHDLDRYFGHEVIHCIDYYDRNWSAEAFSGGCPVGILPTGRMNDFAQCIRRPEGMIHWAGTETATKWPGYMSGAVEAGIRSANEVLHHLRPEKVQKSDLRASIYADDFKEPQLPRTLYYEPKNQFWAWVGPTLGLVTLVGFGAILWSFCTKRLDFPIRIQIIRSSA